MVAVTGSLKTRNACSFKVSVEPCWRSTILFIKKRNYWPFFKICNWKFFKTGFIQNHFFVEVMFIKTFFNNPGEIFVIEKYIERNCKTVKKFTERDIKKLTTETLVRKIFNCFFRCRYQEEDKDLEAQVLSKGLRLTPIRKYEYQSAV